MPAVRDASRCPQCGASVELQEEDAFVHCPFCGSLLHLGDASASHLLLQPAIDQRELPTRLTKWLDDREALGKPVDVTTRLLFFPFWNFIDGAQSKVVPAAPLLALDLERFALPSGDLKSFRADNGAAETIEPKVVPEAVMPAAAVKGARLLHLPFWEVRFALWKRSYTIWIDAAAGQVLAFELPVTSESRLDWTYGLLLFAMYAVLLFAFHRVFSPGPKLVAILIILLTAPVGLFLSRKLIALSERT